MDKVSIYDLTVAQIESVELAVGLPMSRWKDAPSQAQLYAHVMAAATGRDIEEFRALPVRDLLDAITVENADPNP